MQRYNYGLEILACKFKRYFKDRNHRVNLGLPRSEYINKAIDRGTSRINNFEFTVYCNDLVVALEYVCELFNYKYAYDNTVMCHGKAYGEVQIKVKPNQSNVSSSFLLFTRKRFMQ